jgi:hypothetical protein
MSYIINKSVLVTKIHDNTVISNVVILSILELKGMRVYNCARRNVFIAAYKTVIPSGKNNSTFDPNRPSPHGIWL